VEESKEEDASYITKSKLWPYFNASCYEGFNPANPKNFYAVYGDLFRRFDREEEQEEEVGVDHESILFGDQDSSMEEVYKFYGYY